MNELKDFFINRAVFVPVQLSKPLLRKAYNRTGPTFRERHASWFRRTCGHIVSKSTSECQVADYFFGVSFGPSDPADITQI